MTDSPCEEGLDSQLAHAGPAFREGGHVAVRDINLKVRAHWLAQPEAGGHLASHVDLDLVGEFGPFERSQRHRDCDFSPRFGVAIRRGDHRDPGFACVDASNDQFALADPALAMCGDVVI